MEQYTDMCLTELFANMDEDNALQRRVNESISLNEMRHRGLDNCGFEGIRPLIIDESLSIFENTATMDQDENFDVDESSPAHVATDQIVTKRRLTELSIEVIR